MREDSSYVYDPHMLFGVADELDAEGKPFSGAKVRGLAEELTQARAVMAALDGVTDEDLREIERSLRSRITGDLQGASPEQTLAAMAAEANSDDPAAAVGRFVGRALAYRQMFEAASR